jgi:hypothetical protein
MVVIQCDCLGVQLIQMRSFYPGVSIAPEVAISLVVSDDEDNVGLSGYAGLNPKD